MKRFGNLFPAVCDAGNLLLAYKAARKGKGSRQEVARFELDLEDQLLTLRESLLSGSYRPGAYRYRAIYERKPRLISVAPFRDRVVHHALMRVVDPLLDPTLIHDCYACRQGKGVHAAVARYQQFANRHAYVLHLDIRQYFPSIDHATLKTQLHRKLKDQQVLGLFDAIIDSYSTAPGKGLPIGNLTSQFLANYYLSAFDHWLQQEARVAGYLRYVDDFFVFGDDKAQLWQMVTQVQQQLAALALALHPDKIELRRTSERVDMLGYVLTARRRWLRNDNGYRARRRLKGLQAAYGRGALSQADVRQRLSSWIGHAMHGETEGLRRTLFADLVFVRATGQP